MERMFCLAVMDMTPFTAEREMIFSLAAEVPTCWMAGPVSIRPTIQAHLRVFLSIWKPEPGIPAK